MRHNGDRGHTGIVSNQESSRCRVYALFSWARDDGCDHTLTILRGWEVVVFHIGIGWDNAVKRGPGGACLRDARCDRETRQALWGDDLGEGPLQAEWPRERALAHAVHGADLHPVAGQGPPVLGDGNCCPPLPEMPPYPKQELTNNSRLRAGWSLCSSIPNEWAADVIFCARR